jgi:hypothetical protein
MVELLPNPIVVATQVVLVCFHDIHHHLRVLVLLNLGNAAVGQDPLPICR